MVCCLLIIPDAQAPDIAGCPLLEEAADLLDLGLARGGVEQQVAELGGVGLDVDGTLRGSGVAFEHQDLVLGATFLLECMHRAGRVSVVLVEAWRQRSTRAWELLLSSSCPPWEGGVGPKGECGIRRSLASRVKIALGTVDIMIQRPDVQEELTNQVKRSDTACLGGEKKTSSEETNDGNHVDHDDDDDDHKRDKNTNSNNEEEKERKKEDDDDDEEEEGALRRDRERTGLDWR